MSTNEQQQTQPPQQQTPSRPPLIPAVSYGRVSTDPQVKHGTSLEAQREGCAKAIEANGGYVLQHFSDDGVSGEFYLYRPGIQAALAMIESGQARILCIDMVDRSGRNVDAVRDIAKRVWAARGVLLFVNQGVISNNAIGRFTLTSQASAAELLKELVKENTMRGRRKKAIAGQQPTRGTHPYGYHIVTKTDVLTGAYPASEIGRYQIVLEEAEVVLSIFTRILGGESIRGVVRWLFGEGIWSPGNGGGKNPGSRPQWPNSTVEHLLKNPLYKGEPVWGTERHTQTEDRLKAGYKTPRYSWSADPADWVPLSAPAIVSPEMWNAVQEAMCTNQAAQGGNPKRRYLLSGIVRCHLCEARCTGMMTTSGRKPKNGAKRHTTMHYRCQWAQQRRNASGDNCPGPHYHGATLEKIAAECLNFLITEADTMRAAVARWEECERARIAAAAAAASAGAGAADTAAKTPQSKEDTAAEVLRLRKEIEALEARQRAIIEAQVAGIQAGADPRFYNDILIGVVAEHKEATDALQAILSPSRDAQEVEVQRAAQKAEERALRGAAEVLAAGVTGAAVPLAAVLQMMLADDAAPAELRQGAVARVIERIVPVSVKPEGRKYSMLIGADVYLREDFFTDLRSGAVAMPAAAAAAAAEPLSARRLLRNGARITLHAAVRAGGAIEITPEIVTVDGQTRVELGTSEGRVAGEAVSANAR